MQSRGARFAVVATLAVVAVALFIVLRDDEGDSGGGEDTVAEERTTAGGQEPPEPAFETIRLRDGAPVGGVRELTYAKGDRIRIEVRLDQPQEDVHIHGYEVERLNPSGTIRFDFPARLDGLFELEAHGPSGDVVLAEIRVNP
jgi:hypothetical protein